MNKRLSNILLYSPLIWISGVNILFYHIYYAAVFFKTGRVISKNTKAQHYLLMYIFLYFISLLSSFFFYDYEFSRYVGSFFNLTIWVICYLAFSVGLSDSMKDAKKSGFEGLYISENKLFVFSIFIFLFAIIPYFIFEDIIVYKSLLGNLGSFDQYPLISDNTSLRILVQDWTSGEFGVRSSILSPYPTASGMLGLVGVYICTSQKKTYKSLAALAIFLLLIFASGSRAVLFATIIFTVSFVFLLIVRSVKQRILMLYVFLVFLFFAIVYILFFSSFVDDVYKIRESSSNLRFAMYNEALSLFYNNPILGVGVKPRSDIFPIPIGSHSTYLGILTKNGVLGMFMYSLFIISILLKGLHRLDHKNTATLLSILFSFSFFALFEDVDSPILVSTTVFYLLGYYYNFDLNLNGRML